MVDNFEVQDAPDFSHKWPNGTVERFTPANVYTVDGVAFRLGFTWRTSYGKNRRRLIAFAGSSPTASPLIELVGCDDYDSTRELLWPAKQPGSNRQHRVSSSSPEAFQRFNVVPLKNRMEGPRTPDSWAVVLREDDVNGILRLAQERLKQKVKPSDAPPEKVTSANWWVEKTKIAGVAHRVTGEFALGYALITARRSSDGKDIYRFMRDVKPGDLVLHLTDHRGFTGYSRVAASFEDREGLPGADGAGYLVRLEGFTELEPPLLKDVMFASPLKERFAKLIDDRERNPFFHRKATGVLDLTEGGYLTPARPPLLGVLDQAYEAVAGVGLTDTVLARATSTLELIGAGDGSEIVEQKQFLDQHGRVAIWWSFGIRREYRVELGQRFVLNYYTKGSIIARYHVAEVQTGDDAIPSPWQSLALPAYRDKTNVGPAKNQQIRTWLLIDRIDDVRAGTLALDGFEQAAEAASCHPRR